ncbi:MAG: branched-chain amino acid ABC transporter permease [Spirochaetes bacterium]|nr:branched-chain amino acid ABC transporter permease [Spirochaetota bacterium]
MRRNVIVRAIAAAVWLTLLAIPFVLFKADAVERTASLRPFMLLIVFAAALPLSLLWNTLLARRREETRTPVLDALRQRLHENPVASRSLTGCIIIAAAVFPWVMPMYQTDIMSTALIYVMLGLGLNIVVGFGGQLNLGYVAFYAAGAYTYALLNHHYKLDFWCALPLGGIVSMALAALIALPLLRLKGDYLAIVTLAFAEIMRLVLENWGEVTFGPSGIADIPRPALFGMTLPIADSSRLVFYIALALALMTIVVIRRLEHSRLGRSWVAMREDELACQAMGINVPRIKLLAFVAGAAWAGFAGVLFAAKTQFINPASFTIWESLIVLGIVVLGGIGSVPGVIIAALVMTLLPEYLRAFAQYRLLIYGALLVAVMIFRPGGLIPARRMQYRHNNEAERVDD